MVRIKTSTEADLANLILCDGMGRDGVCKSIAAWPRVYGCMTDLLECLLCCRLRSPRLLPDHVKNVTSADVMVYAAMPTLVPKWTSPQMALAKAQSEMISMDDAIKWKEDEFGACKAGLVDLYKMVTIAEANPKTNQWDTTSAWEAMENARTEDECKAECDQYIAVCEDQTELWRKKADAADKRIKETSKIHGLTKATRRKKRGGMGFSRKKGSRR